MVDSYPFRFIKYEPGGSDSGYLRKALYSFKSTKSNKVYIVEVEFYERNFYGIKFFFKGHRLSEMKYNLLTGDNEPRKIIFTCISIMGVIFESDAHSSFGFIGSNNMGEGSDKTKRYRVYSVIINTYFGENTFEHHYNDEKSTYVLIRKSEIEIHPDLPDKISLFISSRIPLIFS